MGQKRNETAISDEEIIAALLTSGTIKAAAAQAGLSQRAIYDRMTDREFNAKYSAAKSDIMREAVNRINDKLTKAIDTIAEIMENKETAAATRLQAAQAIITNAEKFAGRLTAEEVGIINNTRQRSFFDI